MNLRPRLSTAAAAAALALSVVAAPSASAQSSVNPSPQQLVDGVAHAATTAADSLLHGYDPFYDEPVADLGAPGTLLRTQDAPHLLNVLGPDFPGSATKILYTSTTVHGQAVATSGFVIEPANPWQGEGPTPTIVFAPGTRGAGDACAPSRGPWFTARIDATKPAASLNYELGSYYAASLLGMRVVVVDYIGLGTPGAHTYVLHDEEGHAMLDAARAMVPSGDPVGFYGYSQGGGAAAAAAEMHPTYAPELNIKGTFAGAPPADLLATIDGVDTSLIAAVLGYAANGWLARYPEFETLLSDISNDRGIAFFADTANSCIPDDALRWAMTDTRTLTKDGRSLREVVEDAPAIAKLFDDQKLGRVAPTTPILVSTGGNDTEVPSSQVIALARDYCAVGANSTLLNENVPAFTPGKKYALNHAAGMFTQAAPSFIWMLDRFNGIPAASNCGTF